MPNIIWENPFCGEGNSCFRLGTDADGNAYIAVSGQRIVASPTPSTPCAP